MSRSSPGNPRLTAESVLKDVGGPGNVMSLSSCFTRIRFNLRDDTLADVAALGGTDGVLSVIRAAGQLQVVLGHDALIVREALEGLISAFAPQQVVAPRNAESSTRRLFDRFLALVSGLFQPFLWVLAGTGLLKALIMVVVAAGFLRPADTSYVILNAGADALFHFLPMFLAVTASKRFGANQFVSLALAGGLLHPAITALGSGNTPVTFFTIPVAMSPYASSVAPIIIIVWVQSHIERWLKAHLQTVLNNFLSPGLVVLVLFPVGLILIGPASAYLSRMIAAGVAWIYAVSPLAGGFIIGSTAQVLVVFGLHWAVIAGVINEYATTARSLTVVPLYAAVAAQAGAATAVLLRSRDAALKAVAAPAVLSGVLGGITEPILYGVNVPLRRPFFIALFCGGLGGALGGASGVVSRAFAVPSLLTLPLILGSGNVTLFLAGVVGAFLLALVLTLAFGLPAAAPGSTTHPGTGSATSSGAEVAMSLFPQGRWPVPKDTEPAGATVILAPVAGTTQPIESMADPAFTRGALGEGLCVIPTEGLLRAPVTGVVKACLPHAYGIRSDTGVDVLVHVGVDTLRLDGNHFTSVVGHGDRVVAGDILGTVDLTAIRDRGGDPITAVMVTNSKQLARFEALADGVVQAGDPLIRVLA